MMCKGNHGQFFLKNGFVDHSDKQTLRSEALLNIEQIQYVMTSLGKNDLDLRKEYEDDLKRSLENSSSLTYKNDIDAINESLKGESREMTIQQGYFDQDLFIVLVLGGLIETNSMQVDYNADHQKVVKFNFK